LCMFSFCNKSSQKWIFGQMPCVPLNKSKLGQIECAPKGWIIEKVRLI
jgi:hypothetical protein